MVRRRGRKNPLELPAVNVSNLPLLRFSEIECDDVPLTFHFPISISITISPPLAFSHVLIDIENEKMSYVMSDVSMSRKHNETQQTNTRRCLFQDCGTTTTCTYTRPSRTLLSADDYQVVCH